MLLMHSCIQHNLVNSENSAFHIVAILQTCLSRAGYTLFTFLFIHIDE
uniref:Uncharacterized protein n=1 Tax=Anguilla anguilla TaxID=7936 RepID=A0A0E9Y0Y9_ANGAN